MADQTGAPQPAPQLTIPRLRRRLGDEREALDKSFDKLTDEVGEAVDAARHQAAEVGRRARVVAPVVGGALVALLAARRIVRGRRRRS